MPQVPAQRGEVRRRGVKRPPDVLASVRDRHERHDNRYQLSHKPGSIGCAGVLEVADQIERARQAGVDGVVITQVTDTIDETSFAGDLLTRDDIAIVVSGAMRHNDHTLIVNCLPAQQCCRLYCSLRFQAGKHFVNA
ncbi:MAG: hypothetical protein GEU98_02475 [Pseudonocardiaceae bacterium]|nr:hypothetical protein [Pseudonocardiaceae bacterium]